MGTSLQKPIRWKKIMDTQRLLPKHNLSGKSWDTIWRQIYIQLRGNIWSEMENTPASSPKENTL